MPTIPEGAPRVSHTFGGHTVSVPYIFAKNHKLTENEAKGLNRYLASHAGNYFAGRVRRAGEDYAGTPQTDFDDVFSGIELGVASERAPGSGSASKDPIARAMHNIAQEAVKSALTRKGFKVKDFQTQKNAEGVSKLSELTAQYAERNADSLRALAEAQVAAQADDVTLEGLDLPTPESAAA